MHKIYNNWSKFTQLLDLNWGGRLYLLGQNHLVYYLSQLMIQTSAPLAQSSQLLWASIIELSVPSVHWVSIYAELLQERNMRGIHSDSTSPSNLQPTHPDILQISSTISQICFLHWDFFNPYQCDFFLIFLFFSCFLLIPSPYWPPEGFKKNLII